MKKTLFKRTMAGIAALALAAGAVSCGKNTEEGKEPKKGSTEIKNAARAEKLSDAEFNYVNYMSYLPDMDKLVIVAADSDYNLGIYTTDKSMAVFDKLPIELGESDEYSYSNAYVGKDGTIAVGRTTTDYGDFELPDYDDPNFDYEHFDWDAMEEAGVTTSTMTLYDIDGNELSTFDFNVDDSSTGNKRYYGSSEVFVVDKDTIISSEYDSSDNQVLIKYDSKGSKQGELSLGKDSWFSSSAATSDGKLALSMYGQGSGMELKLVNTDTMQFESDTIDLSDAGDDVNGMFTGFGDQLIYFTTGQGIFGVSADGTVEEKVNWIDSGMNSYDYSQFAAVGEDEFVMYSYDYNGGNGSFNKLSKIDSSEFENTIVVTIAVLYDDYELTQAVNDFNNSNTDYRIRVENYSKYDDYEYIEGQDMPKINNTAADQLKKDIIAGKTPDMICCYDRTVMDTLANKGAFTDLYQYMGKDGTISKDELMPNLLEALETDGKLYSIAPSFYLYAYAVKSKYYNKDTWTVSEFIDTFRQLPEGAKVFQWGNSKDTVLSMLLYGSGDYVDYRNGTCDFDNEDFINLLKFCNEFPDEEEDINWETATEEEITNYSREQELAYRNDKAFVYELGLSWLMDYKESKVGRFGEDINIVGYPSKTGNGLFLQASNNLAILEDSPSKEACWRFISTLFTEDYQKDHCSYNIPMLATVFDQKFEEAMQKPYYEDENGKKVEYDDTVYINDEEIIVDPLTQEECDFLREKIMSANQITSSYSTDVYNIVSEEVQAYFNGEKSAEDTAAMIQNRVSILISEQS
ncbi:MAG: extracellular solute-binding protein [Ruminococcus sp.]|nr:extracellular solute-binding protein [Ruminococcus sp.]